MDQVSKYFFLFNEISAAQLASLCPPVLTFPCDVCSDTIKIKQMTQFFVFMLLLHCSRKLEKQVWKIYE